MARRRSLTGRPLLVATIGVALTAASCNGPSAAVPPPGNLMPPPMIQAGELCVEVVPADAVITVDGKVVQPGCVTLPPDYESRPVAVHVSARGYVDQDQNVPLADKMSLKVTLEAGGVPELPPMGNLMPPPAPPPPPVGNLIAPPPIDPPKPK